MWCSVYAKLSCRMAFKENQILTCFLLIWLGFIKVSGFVVFNEEKIFDSEGSFNKNARTMESFDRGEEKPKSGEHVGRLLILQDQVSNSKGDGDAGLFSDLMSQGRADENAYQSDDPGWMMLQPLWGQVYGLNTLYSQPVERLLGMKPKVDCVGDLMKLTVHGREAHFGSNFLIDRGSIPPLPLSQLPSECGHRFLRTWRDFVFIIPYDGCYVSQERGTFVLPLLWWGLPVKMSCSSLTPAPSAPTVSCYTNGMIVRLHTGVNEKLKIKVKNEWQPLLNVSARCGYSLVSHPEGVVIHAPYMPCTEPTQDGMFTLSMATESDFNLSCPALSLNRPLKVPDHASEKDTSSIPHAPFTSTPSPTAVIAASTTTTRTAQPDFKPAPRSYPFLFFPPNFPSTVVPQGPKVLSPPTAITQGPQAPVYSKCPQTWYPWYHKPTVGLTPDPSQSTALPYTKKPLSPTKAPLLKPTSIPQVPIVPPAQLAPVFPPSNMVYPLYPGKPATSSARLQVPYWPYHSQTQLRPSETHAPFKPESAQPVPAPTKKAGQQLLHYLWYKPFAPPPSEIPPVPAKVSQNIPASTSGPVASSSTTYSKKSGQTVNPQVSAIPYQSAVKGPPMSLLDFTPSTSPPPPKFLEVVHSLAPVKPPMAPISSAHAHGFHFTSFCPGPPCISYHHHNHHHFGHPFAMSNPDTSSLTKILGQMPVSSSVISPGPTLFPFIQGMGYNYGPLSSRVVVVPPAAVQYLEYPPIKVAEAPDISRHVPGPTMRPYIFRKLESTASPPAKPVIRPLGPSKPHSRPKNEPVAEPLAYPVQSPNPVYQAKIQHYVPPLHTANEDYTQQMFLAPNNVPPFEKIVQRDMPSKPIVGGTNGKNELLNYWYQATNSNSRPPLSDSPGKKQMLLPQPSNNASPVEESTTPEHTHGKNPPMQLNSHPLMQIRNPVPVMNPQLYYTRNGGSMVPVITDSKLFDTGWVPGVQPNQKS